MNKISIVLFGYGNIGKAFVDRIENQREFFKDRFSLEVEFLLIVRSKVFRKNNEWLKFSSGIELLQQTFKEYPNNHYVLVDCTASGDMLDVYLAVKGVKASIITANKAPLAADYSKYISFQSHLKSNNISFFHEASVGAGLPIVKPLQSLLYSGDCIHSIQGVFSGTLTYLFSQVDLPFSKRLEAAYNLGYTEPDPRVDLSGLDVARKCLVLARMMGSTLSLSDVRLESLVPANLGDVSIDDFFKQIKSYDQIIEKREQAAQLENKKLCYVGTISKSSIEVGLIAVDSTSDFYNLTSTLNLVQVHSEYYPQSYSIKGPGAGIEVTVNGLFSDFFDAILV